MVAWYWIPIAAVLGILAMAIYAAGKCDDCKTINRIERGGK